MVNFGLSSLNPMDPSPFISTRYKMIQMYFVPNKITFSFMVLENTVKLWTTMFGPHRPSGLYLS